MLSPWIFFPLMLMVIGIVVATILFIIYRIIEKRNGYGAPDGLGIVGAFFLVVGVGTGLITLIFTAFPYNPHYWFMEKHSGTVVAVSNQFDNGSGDNSKKEYVVELEGDSIPYLTRDSRILSFKSGDTLNLNCTNNWVYGGSDTTTCNIIF